MVMAPTQLSSSAAPRKSRQARLNRQGKLEGSTDSVPIEETGATTAAPKKTKVPAIRKASANTASKLSSVSAPKRGRSPKVATQEQPEPEDAPATTTRKRKKPPSKQEQLEKAAMEETDKEPIGEEEEDDGFAFRRKAPRTVKALPESPVAAKKSSKLSEDVVKPKKSTKTASKARKSKRLNKSDPEVPSEASKEPPIVNGQSHQSPNGKSTENGKPAPAKTKKATKAAGRGKKAAIQSEPAPSNSSEFTFEDVSEYDAANGRAKHPPAQKHKSHNPFINQPVPNNVSAHHNTSFQHPLVGEFRDENDQQLFSPAANTPPPVVKSQQIALPLSDTPIIRKNQEMRNKKSGVRRSSLGNRGKRASSIGNGFVAVPHSAVSPKEFYKHLDADMPEPHRMKQLLLWSLKRVMETQEETYRQIKMNPAISAEDSTAISVARVIQEEIVRDVSEGRISTSWWNRPVDSDLTETVKKPNVQNVTNQRNFEAFEKRYNELLKEQEQWKSKLEQVRTAARELASSSSKAADKSSVNLKKEFPMLEKVQTELSTSATLDRLQASLTELEYEVDRLDDFAHRAGAVSKAASIFSSNQMSRLKQHLSKSQQTPLNPGESILGSLVEASEARQKENSAAGSSKQETQQDAATALDGVSIRDILRTITRLERNPPS